MSSKTSNRATLLEKLQKAEELKGKTQECKNLINNQDAWVAQQQLLKLYQEILLNDLEFALDKKVEQDLWNFCFKNHIGFMQTAIKDKKNNPSCHQIRLSWFLDCASGFYLTILQAVCSLYNIDLPFKRSNSFYGIRPHGQDKSTQSRLERNSCYYFCQHCLVHLGDIARYKNSIVQAESFYREAVALGPSSGHPYNQLALLEASRMDRLSTVFYYTRAIAVSHKFPAALTNIVNVFQKCLSNQTRIEPGKVIASDYEAVFLKLFGVLNINQNIQVANALLMEIVQALTPLMATQEFSSWKLVQMVVISIFTYTHVENNKLEVQKIVCEFLGGFLNALLVPVYTMTGETVFDYIGLPAIKVLMSWMKCEPKIIISLNKLNIWRGVCKLLNALRSSHSVTPVYYLNSALPEDHDLQSFLPLDPVLSSFNYNDELSVEVERKLRAFRLVKLGDWLATAAAHNPVYIGDNGQFDVALNTCPEGSGAVKPMNATDNKSRVRSNVALQSILRLSQNKDIKPDGLPTFDKTAENPSHVWPSNSGEGTHWPMNNQERVYSLFSAGVESPVLNGSCPTDSTCPPLGHQSLWSGPGPSPLERLLEQQKQQRKLDT